MRLRARQVAPVVLAVVATFIFRVGYGETQELRLARAAVTRGDREVAIDHYRRALRFHVPLFCRGDEATAALFSIGATAEAAGDRALALAAARSVRAGILASRSFYVPHRDALARADRDVVRLVAAEPRLAIEAQLSPSEVSAANLALLESTPPWRSLFLLVTLLGLATWVYAAFAFVSRAIDAEDRLVRPAARRFGSIFAIGIALFVVGLAFT